MTTEWSKLGVTKKIPDQAFQQSWWLWCISSLKYIGKLNKIEPFKYKESYKSLNSSFSKHLVNERLFCCKNTHSCINTLKS